MDTLGWEDGDTRTSKTQRIRLLGPLSYSSKLIKLTKKQKGLQRIYKVIQEMFQRIADVYTLASKESPFIVSSSILPPLESLALT